MPVGAGSIKRVSKASGSTENAAVKKKPATKKNTQKEKAVGVAKIPVAVAKTQVTENQQMIYHVTEELPFYLL